jgi:16S rRNA (guanine527-N7)-methyltransferase
LSGSVAVHAARAEALAGDPAHRGQWSAVAARAVGDLADLVRLAFPLLRPRGCLVAWKRGEIESELRTAARAAEALGGAEIELRDVRLTGLAGHRLVIVSTPARAS